MSPRNRDVAIVTFLRARCGEQERTAAHLRSIARLQRHSDDIRKVADRVRALAEAQRDIVDYITSEDGDEKDRRLLRVLATLYADHPDYRQEWTPDRAHDSSDRLTSRDEVSHDRA